MQLLPIQREFFEADAVSHNHNNQAVLLTAPAGFDLPLIVEALYQHHDALRLRFAFADDIWQAVQAPLTAAMISESCVIETLPEDPSLQSNFIRERCAHYLRGLDVTHGPLFRAVHLKGHAEKQGRLLLVIHHVAVDDVSWRVLLRDLDAAYRKDERATKNSSYEQWGEALTAYATSDALQRERHYWHDNCGKKVEPWPVPPLSKEPACYASVRSVPVQLSVEDTAALLKDCTATYHTDINELLLSAVYLALRQWSGQTRVRITVEQNGREDLFPEIDVTETVGCFTTRYPLVLHSEARELSAVIKSVKEQYRAVPHQGIGYGLLRYVVGDEVLISADSPILLFRYQGELNQVMHSVDPHRLRSHALCLNGSVVQGALRFQLEYSEKQYSKETITVLTGHLEDGLRALIAHLREDSAGYYTLSDFPLATVDEATLNEWQTTYDIDQLYPATAMQKGMFFHSLLDRAAYVTQLYSTIEGDLQLPLLQQAWQTVVERHAMLRTVFVGDGEQQHQLVTRRVSLPWYEEDLRGMSAEKQSERFEQYRKIEKEQGFAPAQAPLMRLSMFRLNHDQYRLLWSHHHSLLDGWAIRLVFTEVMQVYAALSEGLKPVLPAVAEYARYIEWLLAQDKEKARQYWQTYLADVETVTRLPYNTQARQQKPNHQVQEVSLSAGEMAQLKALAKKHHTTVNTLLQLAWGVVLQSYAGEKKVVFGAVISGRLAEVAEIERMVGLCINSIPVVVSLNGDESLVEAIRRLHSTFQPSQKYGYLPLTEIQNQSRLSRGTPLFESLLVFENYARDLTNAVGNGAGSVRMGEFGANLQDTYPLELSMFQGESLQVSCKYFGDLFSAATIRRMLGQFIHVLQQLPNCEAVTDIRLLSEAERQQLLEWNQTAVAYRREKTIHDLFMEQAARTPAAVAVECEGARLSYADLNRRANQLARYLRRLGVGPEVRVGLSLERSPELLVALLGILKAGGAYVPLDREYPPERLRFMIEDAQLRLVLINQQALAAFEGETGAQLIDITAEAEQISRESEADLESGVSADNLAYVIYTSGSTGIPKGVAITHGNASAFIHWAIEFFSASRLQAVLASTSINFDLSVFEFFAPLSVGGRVVLVENALQLATLPADSNVELINTVPSAMAELVRQRAIPSSVRVVNLAGEALLRKLVQEIYALGTVEQVINLYGPSEDTTYSTYEVVADAVDEPVLIGRPISNSQIYLLDREMQPVAIGVPGELYIAGDGLARGYLNRAQLTAERFLPNPFAREAGERLYRTGDLARYREDGLIEYLGRLDQQVKVRGFRIELGEIEAQLERHPLVRECVVTANEAKAGGKRLVAYVVEAETVTVSELQHYLKDKLPKYMVPQLIVKLEQLPLTANGKVDRNALRTLEQAGEETEVGYVAPQTAEEELLAGIWAEVLGVERVSVHDNFFERGGHSLLATQVVSRIRALFGIDLPLRTMFETTTVAELAQLIVTERQADTVGTGPAIERRSRDKVPALSYAQQRLWFLDQLDPQSALYNVPAAISLKGELDSMALAQSLSEIAQRHEVLRTSFPSVTGEPIQQIAPPAGVKVSVIDLQAVPEESKAVKVRQLAAKEAARPFDLARGPLWRVKLLRLAEQDHVLLLTMHHIVTDGWSVGVLLRELTALYDAYSRAEASPLAELPIQYADFAEWQREWLRGPVLEEQMGYWREQLAGSSGVLELPTDHAHAAVQSYRGTTVKMLFSEELTRGLRELSRREGVTLFMTLLSGWQTLLARYSGQWDLNVGTPIANRTRSEVEGLIGFFVNTLVLRTRMEATRSFREQLQQVREVCLGAYAHQDVPFEMIVEELQPDRDMSRSPLFQVVFVLQNAPLGEFEIPAGLKLETLEIEQETAKFELMLTAMETEAGLEAWCNYRTDLFEETTIARMLEHWRELLEAAVADPEQSLSALPLLLSEAERQRLEEWNNNRVIYAQAKNVGPRNFVEELIA